MKKFVSMVLLSFILSNSLAVFSANNEKYATALPNWEFETFNSFIQSGECGNYLTWELIDGTLTISGVGDMYNYNSTNIPWHDFSSDIEEVVIEDTVTSIGDYSFYDCFHLERINIPDSVTEIGKNAFEKCSMLENIVIPDSVSFIGSSAFEECSYLESITLSKNLTKLYPNTFVDCESLREITLYEGLTSIEESVFAFCSSLETMYMPKSITSIGTNALSYSNLQEIIYNGSKQDWDNITFDSEYGSPIPDDCKITYLADMENIDNIIETECPHCFEVFEVTEDEYEDYENIVCPYCDEYISYTEDNIEYLCANCFEPYDPDEQILENYETFRCPNCDFYKSICPNCNILSWDFGTNFQCKHCGEVYVELEFDTSDWAYNEVTEAYEVGIIPDEMFFDNFNSSVTREEFAAIAVKLYETATGSTISANFQDIPFDDCDYNSPYNDYIAIAYVLGITNGTGPSTFSPHDFITREQLATMIFRVVKLAENMGMNMDGNYPNIDEFYDDGDISDYAKESVYFLARRNIIKGVNNYCFAPLSTATKEQAILLALRCRNKLGRG